LLQTQPEALGVVDGAVVRNGAAAGPSISLGEIARHLSPGSKTLGGRPPGLTAEGWFHTDHMNYPYGVHVAVVQVDRETGAVKVPRYLVAYDIGKAVNPMLVEGQIVGGVVQGLGGTLLEEFLYDDRGEPLSVNFADYLMPTTSEVPAPLILHFESPSPFTPLGAKGVGEGNCMSTPVCIANAVADALGIAEIDLPLTPAKLAALIPEAA